MHQAQAANSIRCPSLSASWPGMRCRQRRCIPSATTAASAAPACGASRPAAPPTACAPCPPATLRPSPYAGWRPRFAHDGPVRPWAEPALRLLAVWVPRVPALLTPWSTGELALHPCLCDVWHDHVLFEGDAVSGIVDYGSVKIDHASADL